MSELLRFLGLCLLWVGLLGFFGVLLWTVFADLFGKDGE